MSRIFAEWPIMAVEALCLLMIIIALVSGNAAAQAAFALHLQAGCGLRFSGSELSVSVS